MSIKPDWPIEIRHCLILFFGSIFVIFTQAQTSHRNTRPFTNPGEDDRPGAYHANAVSRKVEHQNLNRPHHDPTPLIKFTGVVRMPDGMPAPGLPVIIVGDDGSARAGIKTGDDGRFEICFSSLWYESAKLSYYLLVRDVSHNLVASQDLDENSKDLDLRLGPGCLLVGQVECEGKPVPLASGTLICWTRSHHMRLEGLSTGTNRPGHFEINALPPGRKFKLIVSAPGFGYQEMDIGETEDATRRIELDSVELRPASLILSGQVLDTDKKPAAGVTIHLYGTGQPEAFRRTDQEGRFHFDQVCEGKAQLSALAINKLGYRQAEAGTTNVILQLTEILPPSSNSPAQNSQGATTPQTLKGRVTEPGGKPVSGALILEFPNPSGKPLKSGENGEFSLTRFLPPLQSQKGNSLLVIRDVVHNRVAATELSDEMTNLHVHLQPALSITGLVQDPNSQPLTTAQVKVTMEVQQTYWDVSGEPVSVNEQGRFEIPALPVHRNYRVEVNAKNYGQTHQSIHLSLATNTVELSPFIPLPANQVVSGQVLNSKNRPVAGVGVWLSGINQPVTHAITDNKGRFQFNTCAGSVDLWARDNSDAAGAKAQAGDTNITIRLPQPRPVPSPLVERP